MSDVIRFMGRIVAALLVAALAGCHGTGKPYVTPQQQACLNQGYRPGTSAYDTCLENEIFWTSPRR
jgi:ribulose bisphosphate carboxylase small subunit